MMKPPAPMGQGSKTKAPKMHVLIIGIHSGKSLGKKSPKSNKKSA